jgi:beta-lactamase superfamily II metal-dependent hydrolase
VAVLREKTFAIHVLDVGQGEAILMDFPDGSFGLLDAGPRADARDVIAPIEHRIRNGHTFRIAGISQWDADHIRGIPAILSRFKPQEFRYPGVDLQLLEQVARKAGGDDAGTLSCEVRDAIETLPPESLGHFIAPSKIEILPGFDIYVLSPMPRTESELRAALAGSRSVPALLRSSRNRTSVALWIRVWGRTLFLTGEVEEDQYRAMDAYFRRPVGPLRQYRKDYSADWIKLSHHGADHNNPAELFKLFAARDFLAVASAGGGYDHPHPNTLNRLHTEHGGRAMCTNLGKGCNKLLNDHALEPTAPGDWCDGLSSLPNPKQTCYGTISVIISEDGKCRAYGASVQSSCPYGGPKTGKRTW